jgi:hypothetical protein
MVQYSATFYRQTFTALFAYSYRIAIYFTILDYENIVQIQSVRFNYFDHDQLQILLLHMSTIL